MGKIVVTEFISLDGVLEAPGGGEDFAHGGWTFEIDAGTRSTASSSSPTTAARCRWRRPTPAPSARASRSSPTLAPEPRRVRTGRP
jgi:hypothetical protein